MGEAVVPYTPMSLDGLAGYLSRETSDPGRWLLFAEFLEEYSWESVTSRWALLSAEPGTSGDHRWDVLLAALAEHLAAQDDRGAPPWAETRMLDCFWFPFNTRAARVDALVHAPAAFRRRGVFLAAHELDVA